MFLHFPINQSTPKGWLANSRGGCFLGRRQLETIWKALTDTAIGRTCNGPTIHHSCWQTRPQALGNSCWSSTIYQQWKKSLPWPRTNAGIMAKQISHGAIRLILVYLDDIGLLFFKTISLWEILSSTLGFHVPGNRKQWREKKQCKECMRLHLAILTDIPNDCHLAHQNKKLAANNIPWKRLLISPTNLSDVWQKRVPKWPK